MKKKSSDYFLYALFIICFCKSLLYVVMYAIYNTKHVKNELFLIHKAITVYYVVWRKKKSKIKMGKIGKENGIKN